MIVKNIYKVAGFYFVIEGGSALLDGMTNLLPFVCKNAGEAPLFCLKLAEALPEESSELYFRTDDGPGFPEISIFTASDGWTVRVKSLPGQKEACVSWIKGDFSEAMMRIIDARQASFAVNNTLMLMFAFSTACRGALEMHSSVVINDGRGYLFLGRSGTGKSTHSSLWMKHIPGTELLNDDNPILRLMPDGSARVFGSPWSGKTPCYKAKDVPAGAVVLLKQAPYNKIQRLSPLKSYATLMSSASSFRPFKALADGWHRTLEGLAGSLPCYTLECLPDQEAAELSYRTIHV